MTFLLSEIENWRAELAALPAPDPTTRKLGKLAAISLMTKELQALCRRGYTIVELVELLRTRGLTIHRDTLRRALREAREASTTTSRRQRSALTIPRKTQAQVRPGGEQVPETTKPEAGNNEEVIAGRPRTVERGEPLVTESGGASRQAVGSPSGSKNDGKPGAVPARPRAVAAAPAPRPGLRSEGPPSPIPRASFTPRNDSDDI